jgi:hypothetical protein
MKRTGIALLMAAMAAVAAWSQPKVAVLDAIIPQNMDPSVIIPTTEKIIERLVVSGRFTVLDRSNIESVLKEREFQVSGMVSDQDVVTAGKYLGADFVVVAKVQKVSDTYFISAKMIAIKTGVIANQTSAQGEGKLSTLIDLAGEVGDVLSGGAVMAQSAAGGSKDISKPEAPPKPRPPAPQRKGSFFGAGLTYSLDTLNLVASDSYGEYDGSDEWSLLGASAVYAMDYLQVGIGYTVSLGATYSYTNTSTSTSGGNDITDMQSFLAFSVLGKYPIRLGSTTLFPLAGIEYDLNLTYTDESGNDLKSTSSDTWVSGLNHLYLQLGVGAEMDLGNIVICPEVVYGWKVKTEQDTAIEDNMVYNLLWDDATATETKLDVAILIGVRL